MFFYLFILMATVVNKGESLINIYHSLDPCPPISNQAFTASALYTIKNPFYLHFIMLTILNETLYMMYKMNATDPGTKTCSPEWEFYINCTHSTTSNRETRIVFKTADANLSLYNFTWTIEARDVNHELDRLRNNHTFIIVLGTEDQYGIHHTLNPSPPILNQPFNATVRYRTEQSFFLYGVSLTVHNEEIRLFETGEIYPDIGSGFKQCSPNWEYYINCNLSMASYSYTTVVFKTADANLSLYNYTWILESSDLCLYQTYTFNIVPETINTSIETTPAPTDPLLTEDTIYTSIKTTPAPTDPLLTEDTIYTSIETTPAPTDPLFTEETSTFPPTTTQDPKITEYLKNFNYIMRPCPPISNQTFTASAIYTIKNPFYLHFIMLTTLNETLYMMYKMNATDPGTKTCSPEWEFYINCIRSKTWVSETTIVFKTADANLSLYNYTWTIEARNVTDDLDRLRKNYTFNIVPGTEDLIGIHHTLNPSPPILNQPFNVTARYRTEHGTFSYELGLLASYREIFLMGKKGSHTDPIFSKKCSPKWEYYINCNLSMVSDSYTTVVFKTADANLSLYNYNWILSSWDRCIFQTYTFNIVPETINTSIETTPAPTDPLFTEDTINTSIETTPAPTDPLFTEETSTFSTTTTQEPKITGEKECTDKGQTWNNIYEECQSETSEALNQLVENITSYTYSEVSSHLDTLTSNPNTLQASDLDSTMQIIEHLAKTTMPTELAINVTTSIMNTISNLLEVKVETISTSSKINNVPNKLIQAFDNILRQMQNSINATNSSITIKTHNIVAEITKIDPRSNKIPLGIAAQFNSNEAIIPLYNNSNNNLDNVDAAIMLPDIIFDNFIEGGQDIIPVTFVILRNSKLFSEVPSSGVGSYSVNIPVISVVIGNGEKNINNLLNPVVLLYKTDKNPEEIDNFTKICSYWNFTLNNNRGGWLNDGCFYNRTVNNSIICHCNHLTYFSVLINNIAPEEDHEIILTYISYIGCGLSTLGLSISLILDWIFRGKLRTTQANQALVNLKISILCVVIIFMSGINAHVDSIACKAVAIMLHYFLLASFLWMLVEALLQYLNFVKVFTIRVKGFLRKSIIVAYGIPLAIVAISAGTNIDFYKGENFCWLGVPFLYYGFLIPIGVIVLINLVVFCLILKSLCCSKTVIKSTNARNFQWIKFRGLICTFFLLGLTWLFAGFSLAYRHIIFEYLFCIFNSLQGFVIAIFHFIVMKNKPEVRSYFKQKSKSFFSSWKSSYVSNQKMTSISEEMPSNVNSYKLRSISQIFPNKSEAFKLINNF